MAEAKSKGTEEEEQVPDKVPVFTTKGLADHECVWAILQVASCDDERVTLRAPCRPIADGEVYVYALRDGSVPNDWRDDGFQWISLRGSPVPRKSRNPYLQRQDFRLLSEGKAVDFFKYEYMEFGPIWKVPIKRSEWKFPFVVIHYHGSFPINEAVNVASRSRRFSGSGFKRVSFTPKPSQDLIASSSSEDHGDTLVKQLEVEAEVNLPCEEIVHSRLDISTQTIRSNGTIKQLQSQADDAKAKLTARRNMLSKFTPQARNKARSALTNGAVERLSMSKEDLFWCYLFSESCPKVIRLMELSEGLTIIVASNSVINHLNNIATIGNIGSIRPGRFRFYYEILSSPARFFMSTLYFVYPYFEGEPCIPVAIMIHTKMDSDTCAKFFKMLKSMIVPLDSPEADIVVPDEAEVKRAVTEKLRLTMKICCSSSAGHRLCPKLEVVMKTLIGHEECDFSRLILAAYSLQCHFLGEIKKTLEDNDESEFRYKSEYAIEISAPGGLAHRLAPSEEIDDALEPHEIINMLTKDPVAFRKCEWMQNSVVDQKLAEGIGRMFLNKDRVQWRKSSGLFTVKGWGSKLYTVNLGEQSCSCPSDEICEHIITVQIGTGLYGKPSKK